MTAPLIFTVQSAVMHHQPAGGREVLQPGNHLRIEVVDRGDHDRLVLGGQRAVDHVFINNRHEVLLQGLAGHVGEEHVVALPAVQVELTFMLRVCW